MKILIVKRDKLGDLLLATPKLAHLKLDDKLVLDRIAALLR